MKDIGPFKLNFLKQENHLLLHNVSSIILVQNLYDILFQYVISPDKEEKLKEFIDLLEAHIKSKTLAPFSIPREELEFLGEGLEELKLLNWIELPISLFEIQLENGPIDNEEQLESIFDLLEEVITFKHKPNSSYIYVYPQGLTSY
ncbi:MAG: hypothetical protein ABFD08_13895 [Syntrophomonas sp.]